MKFNSLLGHASYLQRLEAWLRRDDLRGKALQVKPVGRVHADELMLRANEILLRGVVQGSFYLQNWCCQASPRARRFACNSTYRFSTPSMRDCQPSPVERKNSITSGL